MGFTRRNTSDDATWNRAWTADAVADLTAIAAIVGSERPHHGDIAFVTANSQYYLWLDNDTWIQITNITFNPVNLATQVTGVLPTANGGTSVNIASAALPLGSGQITFPATQNPSADANTLDDYEEGIWTPVDGSGAGLTFTILSASYVKIGHLVYVEWDITYPTTADGAGSRVDGLPFAGPATGAAGGLVGYTTSSLAIYIPILGALSGFYITSPAGGFYTNAQLSTFRFVGSGFYIATN